MKYDDLRWKMGERVFFRIRVKSPILNIFLVVGLTLIFFHFWGQRNEISLVNVCNYKQLTKKKWEIKYLRIMDRNCYEYLLPTYRKWNIYNHLIQKNVKLGTYTFIITNVYCVYRILTENDICDHLLKLGEKIIF